MNPFDFLIGKRKFTLIEIIIVIAVIGLLLAMMGPMISGVEEQANEVQQKVEQAEAAKQPVETIPQTSVSYEEETSSSLGWLFGLVIFFILSGVIGFVGYHYTTYLKFKDLLVNVKLQCEELLPKVTRINSQMKYLKKEQDYIDRLIDWDEISVNVNTASAIRLPFMTYLFKNKKYLKLKVKTLQSKLPEYQDKIQKLDRMFFDLEQQGDLTSVYEKKVSKKEKGLNFDMGEILASYGLVNLAQQEMTVSKQEDKK